MAKLCQVMIKPHVIIIGFTLGLIVGTIIRLVIELIIDTIETKSFWAEYSKINRPFDGPPKDGYQPKNKIETMPVPNKWPSCKPKQR